MNVFGRRDKPADRPRRLQVKQVAHKADLLGECPTWCPRTNRLYWVDILGRKLNCYDPLSGDTRSVSTGDYLVGCIAVIKDNPKEFAAATQEGFGYLDIETGTFRKVVDPEHRKPNNRFNDGKCDAKGRFLAASMYTLKPKKFGTASAYFWTGGPSVQRVDALGKLTTGNGLGWSSDNKRLWYIDSPTMKVMQYKYDVETGDATDPTPVISFSDRDFPGAAPDGLAVDAEDKLWIAMFRGGKITRWDPENGEMLAVIDLPCMHVTSCCFGGHNLETLFITTAKGSSLAEIDVNPNRAAGALFACNVGVRGLPVGSFDPSLASPKQAPFKSKL
eukprot:gene10401-16026_t